MDRVAAARKTMSNGSNSIGNLETINPTELIGKPQGASHTIYETLAKQLIAARTTDKAAGQLASEGSNGSIESMLYDYPYLG